MEKARENALGVDYELHDLISKNGPHWGEIGKIASLCSVGSCRPPFWAQIASFGSVRTKRRVRQPVRHRKSGSRRVKKNGHPERGPRERAQRTAPENGLGERGNGLSPLPKHGARVRVPKGAKERAAEYGRQRPDDKEQTPAASTGTGFKSALFPPPFSPPGAGIPPPVSGSPATNSSAPCLWSGTAFWRFGPSSGLPPPGAARPAPGSTADFPMLQALPIAKTAARTSIFRPVDRRRPEPRDLRRLRHSAAAPPVFPAAGLAN